MSRSLHQDASNLDEIPRLAKQPNVGRELSNEVRLHSPFSPRITMMESPRWRVLVALLALAGAACHPAAGVSQAPPAITQAPTDSFRIRPGVALVANQQSADVSIIDLATGATTRVAVGTGPHEAAISLDGKWGVATVYGAQVPGNQLAILDLAAKNAAFTYSTPDYQSENFVTPGVVRHEVRTASITVGDEAEAKRIAKALTDAATLCGAKAG